LTQGYRPKEIIKRNVADRLESTWNLKPAYPHLNKLKTDMLLEIQNALDYYETKLSTIKSRPGYAKQIINTYKSLENSKVEDSE
jgi:hypothetical protein